MNEIIQSLEADITNGDNNFCMINEKMLLAIKELSKRDYQEQLELKEKTRKQKEVIEKIKKICNSVPHDWSVCGIDVVNKIEKVLKEV